MADNSVNDSDVVEIKNPKQQKQNRLKRKVISNCSDHMMNPGSSRNNKKESENDRARQFFAAESECLVLENSDDPVDSSGVAKDVLELKTEKIQGLRCLECSKVISVYKGRRSGLTSHLSHVHPNIYLEHVLISISANVAIESKRLQLIQHCIKLVAFGNMPFETIRKSFFLEMFQEQLTAFQQHQRSLDLCNTNLKELKEYLYSTADKIVDNISKEILNKPVSLMLDIMSCHQRKIIGLSIQYLRKDKIVVRTIGLMELPKGKRYTRQNVKDAVKDCLLKYGIKAFQIASITSDSGSNVISLVHYFPYDFHVREMEEDSNEDEDVIDVAADTEIRSYEITTPLLSMQHVDDATYDDHGFYGGRDIDNVRKLIITHEVNLFLYVQAYIDID